MPHLAGVVNGPGCGECPFVTSTICFVEVGLLVQRVVLVATLWQPQGADELGGKETVADAFPHGQKSMVESLPICDEDH